VMAWVLNPLSERAQRLASGSAPGEAYTAAAEIIAGRQQRLTARVQVHALHLIMRAARLAGEWVRAAEEVLKRYVERCLSEALRELGWGRSSFDPSLLLGMLEGFEVLPAGRLVQERELRKLAAATAEPPEFAVHWRQLMPAVRRGRLKLASLPLSRGYALLSLRQVLDCYSELVLEECVRHIRSLEPEEDDALEELARRLRRIGERQVTAAVEGKSLKPELFPPCIKNVLAGVGSGLRNYAITVLLTSFISYARIAPEVQAETQESQTILMTSGW